METWTIIAFRGGTPGTNRTCTPEIVNRGTRGVMATRETWETEQVGAVATLIPAAGVFQGSRMPE